MFENNLSLPLVEAIPPLPLPSPPLKLYFTYFADGTLIGFQVLVRLSILSAGQMGISTRYSSSLLVMRRCSALSDYTQMSPDAVPTSILSPGSAPTALVFAPRRV